MDCTKIAQPWSSLPPLSVTQLRLNPHRCYDGLMPNYLKRVSIACFRSLCDLYEYRHMTNACSLAYTTLLSIIPLLSVIIYTGSLSNYFEALNALAKDYAAHYLLPAANDKVIYYLDVLSHQANLAPTFSFLFLLVTAIFLIMSVDSTLGVVWENKRRKKQLLRLFIYFFVIFAIPAIIALGAMISMLIDVMFNSLPWIGMLRFTVPLLINSIMLSILYLVTASNHIRYSALFTGSVVASVLLEVIKILFTVYVTELANYQTIYGALSIIPIFLLWLFIFWTTIIYGALVAKRSHDCNE